ncbi:MAG TPA: hypothetical protein VG537_00860 [Candidatus Kapabacteria bacterium]|nr:hypothetical protein [Candidatus Kapabacteria bacterium]
MKIGIAFFCLLCAIFALRKADGQTLTSPPHVGVEQVPIGEDVYAFLRHLSTRGIIEGYSEAVLPISEYEVAEFLKQADPAKLSDAEIALRAKYLRTYAHDPNDVVTMFPSKDAEPLFFSGIFTDKDKYLYRWFDDSTNSDLFVHGIADLEERHKSGPENASVLLGTIGGRFSGTLSGHVGYFMQTTNGEKWGNSALALEDPVLSRNHNFADFTGQQFFDFTTAELTYNNDWFTGKIAREAIAFGGGYQNDNIILSPDVPTYDFLSLGAHIGAVRYQAMIASLVADTNFGTGYPVKYLALHDLTFMLGHDLELGFTDMMVFSDRFELAYANPFSFLEVVGQGVADQDKDNGLLAMHARWRVAPGFEVRGQGLLDDFLGSKIGTGWAQNKFAWQLGGMWAGAFGISNLDWEAEWMRVEPYTYTHWNTDDNRFTNSGTLLGAQIGPNAESYWSALRWAPSEKWTFSLEGELVLRGENLYDSTGKLLYNAGADYNLSTTQESNDSQTYILNGRRVNIFTITATAQFEPWRGIVVFARGTKSSVNYLSEAPVTPGVNLQGLPISLAPREFPETLVAVGARVLF